MKTKTFKELSIKVTYSVDLSEVEIPEKIAEQMEQSYDRRERICLWSSSKYPNLEQWLINYVKEEDSEDLEYEIEILEANKMNTQNLTIKELVPLIQEWAKEREIYEQLTPFDELLKTHEEVGELIKACYDNDKPAIQDAIGDVMITMINYCYFIELDAVKYTKQAVDLSVTGYYTISYVMNAYNALGRLISLYVWNEGKEISKPSGLRVFSILHYLNGIAHLEGTTLEECLNIAYNEIKNRHS